MPCLLNGVSLDMLETKMALDGEKIDDEDELEMFCIPLTLWVTGI